MNDQPKPVEPWQWPEAHWRKLVNQVRAGRSYRPERWKDGARCAFALSFDSDHDTLKPSGLAEAFTTLDAHSRSPPNTAQSVDQQ